MSLDGENILTVPEVDNISASDRKFPSASDC